MHLHIVRHAKSSRKEPASADFDRPLSKRGRRDAPQMAEHLAARNIRPDWLIASDSARTRATADLVCIGLGIDAQVVHFSRRLYLTDAAALLDVLRETPSDRRAVMLIAHNPGVTDLVTVLTGIPLIDALPTMAVATLDVPFSHWSDLRDSSATLLSSVTPRSIAATLAADNRD